jgi:hypothetical protein
MKTRKELEDDIPFKIPHEVHFHRTCHSLPDDQPGLLGSTRGRVVAEGG